MIKKIGRKLSLPAALIGAGFFGFYEPSCFAEEAIVRAVRGLPKYVSTNGFPVVLRKGDKVPSGAVIRTGTGESVDISLGANGRLVSVAPNSRLKIDPAENKISLEKGELVGSFRKFGNEPRLRPVTLTTPGGVTQLSVGDISVNADQGSHSLLSGKGATFQSLSDAGIPQAPITLTAGSSVMQKNSQATVASLSEAVTANLLARVDTLVSQQKSLAENFRKSSSYTSPTTTQASPEPEPDPTNPGTGTQGYWKNHEDAWPVENIVIGGITYSRDQAIDIMRRSTTRDMTFAMFQQLVAARLNVMIGNQGSCVTSTIAAADAWMAAHPPGSRVTASSSAWGAVEQGNLLMTTLDQYNNGQLCAPHRD